MLYVVCVFTPPPPCIRCYITRLSRLISLSISDNLKVAVHLCSHPRRCRVPMSDSSSDASRELQRVLAAVRRGSRLSDLIPGQSGDATYQQRRRTIIRLGGWLPSWMHAAPGSALRLRVVRFVVGFSRRRGSAYGCRGVRNALREAGIARVPLHVISRIMRRADPDAYVQRVAVVGGGGRLQRISYWNAGPMAVVHVDS